MIVSQSYQYKTKPRKHQAECLRLSIKEPVFALFHEQRTGKSKIIIDTASYHFELYQRALQARAPTGGPPAPDGALGGKRSTYPGRLPPVIPPVGITALIIVAMPSGVPSQWVMDEIPAHMPDRIPRKTLIWRASKVSTKSFQKEMEDLLTTPSLAVLALNGEALITDAFRKYAVRFLNARKRVMVSVDESTLVCKAHNSQRTKMVLALRDHPATVVRRIADGTPYGERPLDFYAQMSFLDERILGHKSFFTFKRHYCVLEKNTAQRFNKDKENDDGTKGGMELYEYDTIKEYRNLDELHRRIARYSHRVRRADVSDAPPKTYQKLRFDLSPEQRRVYNEMEEKYEAELNNEQGRITAKHVLTRWLRLQQITSNMVPGMDTVDVCSACYGDGCDECDNIGGIVSQQPARIIDSKHNPRLETLEAHLSLSSDPAIIWCRFTQDIEFCLDLGRQLGRAPVRYDGKVSADEKVWAKNEFQTGKSALLVGNQMAGGRGLRLSAARAIYYYSNYFSLLVREQSEDRAEDVDQKHSTHVYDLVANYTKDEDIVGAMREKRRLSEIVMQENRGKWI